MEPGDDQGVGRGQQRESPRVAEHRGGTEEAAEDQQARVARRPNEGALDL